MRHAHTDADTPMVSYAVLLLPLLLIHLLLQLLLLLRRVRVLTLLTLVFQLLLIPLLQVQHHQSNEYRLLFIINKR